MQDLNSKNNYGDSVALLFEGERNFIANAANMSSFIFNTMPNLNWAGFYFVDGNELILGPFNGKPACVRIAFGQGVCGTAAMERQTIIVANVHQFPGHIACDSASQSEIVIPIINDGTLYGVFDIDSPLLDRFTELERKYLEDCVTALVISSDIEKLSKYYSIDNNSKIK